jgi:glucose/arabinose dehydrogenase
MVDPALRVDTAVSGLTTPIGFVFLRGRPGGNAADSRDTDDDVAAPGSETSTDETSIGGTAGEESGAETATDETASDEAATDEATTDEATTDETATERATDEAAATATDVTGVGNAGTARRQSDNGRIDMLVIEKSTGQVKRVIDGKVTATVLDLAVNAASERGLLSIALHPRFPRRPFVYLYWTCRTTEQPTDPDRPSARTCDQAAMLGEDTTDIAQVPLLGNRVDRFIWNGETLTFDRNIISLRSFQADGAVEPPGQADAAQNPLGNHNGGVIRFGPDGKLYIVIGDNGRRGWLQNLAQGPTPPTADDQFGGPEPDDAHFTGVVLRLNDDGSAPRDNPFVRAASQFSGQVAANIRKIFAYGFRNSFGMAFDPLSRHLWLQMNGDDTFDEIQRVDRGLNSGWIQTIGPIARLGEFKQIETTRMPGQLQQLRWPPTRIADTPAEARQRLVMLPGAHYADPQFSWRYAVAPAGLGFVRGTGLGQDYRGDLIVGAATPALEGGYLFRFNLTRNRRDLDLDNPLLTDRVADNPDKNDITESESLLIGRNFGVSTDIKTGPNGHLFVVSLTRGEILEVSRTDGGGQ